MKHTKQIQKEVRELIKPQMIEGHYDPILINRCVEATLKAIDYAHSSTQLKELYVLSFEEWKEQNQELIRKSIGITGNEMAIELDLYTNYKTDQLQNL